MLRLKKLFSRERLSKGEKSFLRPELKRTLGFRFPLRLVSTLTLRLGHHQSTTQGLGVSAHVRDWRNDPVLRSCVAFCSNGHPRNFAEPWRENQVHCIGSLARKPEPWAQVKQRSMGGDCGFKEQAEEGRKQGLCDYFWRDFFLGTNCILCCYSRVPMSIFCNRNWSVGTETGSTG